jgi:hypothetical protein
MKKAIVPVWTAALAVLFLFGAAQPALASHFRYGTLSWSPTATPGQVEFRFRAAFRRDSVWGPVNTGAIILETQGPSMLNFGDGTNTGTLRFIITAHSVAENWVIGEALNPGSNTVGVRHTYANPAVNFIAFMSNGNSPACCRLTTLLNRANGDYPLQTIVQPGSGNRSPVSSMVPIVIVPPSADATFLVPAADADFDTLRFRMSTSAEAGGGVHPPNISVEAATGLVHWNNLGLNQSNFWTTQVVIEDLTAPGGTVKSKTPVDFLLKIQPQIGSLPACSFNPAGPYTVLVGQPLTFTVTGTDADPADQVTLHSGGMPPGATLTPPLPVTGPSSGVSTTFNWTPTAPQTGAHVVTFSVTDTPGQQSLCSNEIQVINNVPPTISCPLPISVECSAPGGSTVTRTVHVEDGNGDPLTVTWRVDNVVVQVDNVPAGGPPTSANVSLTHFYPLGGHDVRVDVSDGLAAAVNCTTTVAVADTTPPVVQCATERSTLWPPNHNLRNVGLAVAVDDVCGGGGTMLTVVSVFGDEDDETQTGDGQHSPDAKDIAAGTLRLRSERRGDGDGRVYLILGAVSDPTGNTGVNCCTVTVTHSQSHQDQMSVAAQAAAALNICQKTGAPPANYFVVGDGPIIGPKQ